MKKKSIQNNLHSLLKQFWPLLLSALLLSVLLARNPFSDRTLIPNFEPFPDSFHYITPVRCFLNGEGWSICREDRYIEPSVPPLYGLSMLPFFVINNDPRMVYFTNILLAGISLVLLHQILKKLEIIKSGTLFILLLFVTNFYTYWLPTLAMAENLLIPLFLAIILLFLYPVNTVRSLLAAVLITSLYGVKYSSAPLLPVLYLLYLIKIMRHSQTDQQRFIRLSLIAVTGSVMIFAISPTILTSLYALLRSVLPLPSGIPADSSSDSWAFSSSFFSAHSAQYFSVLWGGKVRYLWIHDMPLFIKWVGFAGLIGLVTGLWEKKTRYISLTLIACGLAQLLFMSVFYVVDARYVNILFPIMLVGIALLLTKVQLLSTKLLLDKYLMGTLIILSFVVLAVSFPRLKAQIGLNLKYAETPWWYLSVKHAELFFLSRSVMPEQPPVLITAIPPHLYDFYKYSNVQLLPLSTDHDFRQNRVQLWGDYNYDNLITIYNFFLEQGRELYVMNYGIGNEQQRKDDFENIKTNFHLQLVKEGCHGACNIWRVNLKES